MTWLEFGVVHKGLHHYIFVRGNKQTMKAGKVVNIHKTE